MKDSASGAVASFQTAFSFQITGIDFINADGNIVHGDGLAFIFAKTNDLKGQDPGSSLCLIKESDNGLASNRLFAVEFDTFSNNWWNDSSDNHIGANINSMNSTWYHSLCGGNVRNCSYLCNGGYFTVWIDYNSSLQKLEVFFTKGSLYNKILKPPTPLIEAALSLSELLDDYMDFVGFSLSVGSVSEVHQIQSWKFTSSGMPEQDALQPPSPGGVLTNPASDSSQKRKVGIISGVCAGAAGAFLLVGFFLARTWRRTSHKKQGKFNLVDQNLVPRMFTYKELCKATKNFSRSELLGSGGFGAVYKGTLRSGALVAVKQMKHESKHGEEGFQAEAASLNQIRHRNLVQLRGWCHEEEQLLLVCDYMCNGSLDEWLFHFSKRSGNGNGSNLNEVDALPLKLRHSVLSRVAAALSCLHEECVQFVLHRDIKSSNVLLDGDLNAYLGDFGLARLIDHQKMEKTTLMAGTLGYMAPEMPHTGKATRESDVYSFGVLMFEVMCGMRPLDGTAIERGEGILVDWVWRAHEAGNILDVADSRLLTVPPTDANWGSCKKFDSQEAESVAITKDMHDVELSTIYALDAATEDKELIANLLHLGLLCCNPNPEDRPSMRLVAQLLQSSESIEMAMPSLPGCKPQAHYSSPGFSQLATIPSSDSTSSSVLFVQDAAQGSFQSTPPSSSVSSGETANEMLTSFAAPDSSVLSGR